jgi:CRISPR/Cas system-associated exonuclease Cas4 (RecB family)
MIGYYLGATAKYGEIAAVQVDYVIRGNQNKPPTFMPILIEVTKQDILDFATEIEEAVAGINAGRFPPLGRETLACRWCPYRKVCKYAKV